MKNMVTEVSKTQPTRATAIYPSVMEIELRNRLPYEFKFTMTLVRCQANENVTFNDVTSSKNKPTIRQKKKRDDRKLR